MLQPLTQTKMMVSPQTDSTCRPWCRSLLMSWAFDCVSLQCVVTASTARIDTPNVTHCLIGLTPAPRIVLVIAFSCGVPQTRPQPLRRPCSLRASSLNHIWVRLSCCWGSVTSRATAIWRPGAWTCPCGNRCPR